MVTVQCSMSNDGVDGDDLIEQGALSIVVQTRHMVASKSSPGRLKVAGLW